MSNNADVVTEIAEQIREKKQEVRFSTREYVAEYLIDKFKEEDFFIPFEYQRNFVWTDKDCSYFIESVLIGLPIPYMFFADTDDGRTEIVDGAQRMNALVNFVNDDLKLADLKILTSVNGKTFSELPIEVQRRFSNASFRVVYLEEGTTVEVRQEIFRRINSSGKQLRSQEIRRGSMDGGFSDLVKSLSQNSLFGELAPLSETARKHYEDMELVTRFFAYYDGYPNFDGYRDRVANYLDSYTQSMNKRFDAQSDLSQQYADRFINMLTYVNESLGSLGFRKSPTGKSTPHARFEAIAVGVAVALSQNQNLPTQDMSWVNAEEFLGLVRSDSANVKAKLNYQCNQYRHRNATQDSQVRRRAARSRDSKWFQFSANPLGEELLFHVIALYKPAAIFF